MKRSHKNTSSFLSVFLSMVLALLLAGCNSGGGGSSATPTPTPTPTPATTTISGKVTLSSTVAGKPSLYNKGGSSNVMNGVLAAAGMRNAVTLSTATVELYDADHPEWLYPVATNITNTAGDYTLDRLCAFNDPVGITNNLNVPYGATYKCGDPIPAGNYTVIASKSGAGASGGQAVAVQAVVKKSSGTVTGNDLVAADSAAIPSVVSMFGLSNNTDGSFGSAATNLPANAAIQVTFSMAMARLSVLDAISIKDASATAVAGTWKISADLLSAMFVPTNALTSSTVFTVTVGGGTAAKTAKNVFGKAIAATVIGSFTTAAADTTPPNAVKESPATSTNVPIITAIRIAANEPLDVTTISVASTPSIGDKPNVIYIGKTGKYQDFNYVYEIVPATPLTVNTDYALTVSGGKDLAGNALTAVTINFKTEATSAGITTGTGTTTAVVDAQTAVKGVLGKWAQALNDQNITTLASYMAGDFYWINDPTKQGNSDDLNHDGRLDLQEFTSMLNTYFLQLKNCGSTISLSVDTANTTVGGGISVDPVTNTIADVAFTLTETSTNTSSQCINNKGPNNVLYAEMQKINGAWVMTRGSDIPLAAVTVALTKIATTAPASGAQLPEPTAAMPAVPDFKWTAGTWTDANGVAQPFASYAVILIDNKVQWREAGWIGIINGATLTAGSAASIRFTPATGLSGSTLVLPSGKSFGFNKSIAEIKAGGDYTWAVLGFKTKTRDDFNLGLASPLSDLGGSSPASDFTVGGIYKELKITVQDSVSKVYYTYNDWMNGYDAANSNSVILSITTPNTAATTATVDVNGYTSQHLTSAFGNGVATVTVNLSNKQNGITICDDYVPGTNGPGNCKGISKQINISTTGGASPKINITSVTGKTCTSTAATLTGPDGWNQYTSTDVCTVDISGTVAAGITGTLNINVGNNTNTAQYRGTATISGTGFAATGIPVFAGSNWVQVSDQMWTNMNQFGVETTAGSTYAAPISGSLTVNGTTIQPKSSTLWDVTYDVGSANTVTATVNMASVNTCTTSSPPPGGTTSPPPMNCSGWSQMDSGGNWIAGGSITASPFTGVLNLYQGWNTINLNDAAGNYFQVKIYTKGGTAYIAPNTVTAVSAGGVTLTPTTAGTSDYNAAANCSVTITGTTNNPGSVNVSLYNYNATTTASISEFQTVPVTGAAKPYSYTITQNVYAGLNSISINDSMWNWQGVNVNSTCTTAPVVFAATVTATAPATVTYDTAMLYWNAGAASSVNISGTAGTGKTITASISSGVNYNTVTTQPVVGTTYTLTNVPIYNGYNYISVTDGANWTYLTVYTTGGAVYVAPFKITSVVVPAGGTGTITSTDATGYSYSSTASAVTISGTSSTISCPTTTPNCITWYGGGTSGTASLTNGAFSIPVTLLNGANYIDLYGPTGSWAGVYINTTGGTAPTKFITITSPKQNALGNGNVPVTATVDLTKGFTPAVTNVWAFVYDYVTFKSTYFTSDTTLSCTTCINVPLTYNATTGVVTFNAAVVAGNTTSIDVYAFDASGVGHGDMIYVNNTLGYNPYNYKPGSTAALSGDVRVKANKAEFLKRVMRR